MGDVWPQLLLVGVLVLINAAFAGSELALVSLREAQLARLEQRSTSGARLAELARQPNRFFATIQIGITLAGFLASASAAVSLAEPVEEWLGFLGGAADVVSVVVVTVILAYFTLVFGELAPKRLALQRPERWGLVVARPLSVLATATRPAVWLLSVSTDMVVRILGGDPDLERAVVTTEEIRDMVAVQGTFSHDQRVIIDGAIEVSDRTLREVLLPRPAVFVLDAELPAGEAVAALAASGHSRAPVAPSANLDDVIGTVHLRDLLSGDRGTSVQNLVSAPLLLPESTRVLPALRRMQRRRISIAMVVSEHGGTEGIVTVEDLVEELVGEIYDETDRDVLSVERRGGTVLVPGRFPAHDLPDIGIIVPDGPYATVAGVVLATLHRVPDVGDSCQVGDWVFTVEEMDERTIARVAVTPVPESGPAPEG